MKHSRVFGCRICGILGLFSALSIACLLKSSNLWFSNEEGIETQLRYAERSVISPVKYRTYPLLKVDGGSMPAQNGPKSTPIILLWTKLYLSGIREPHFEFESTSLDCGHFYKTHGSCLFTHDRGKLSNATTVIVQYRNWDRKVPHRSYYRPELQMWTMLIWESPNHVYSHLWRENPSLPNHMASPEMRDFFNWTMTYRRDSDIPYLYGYFHPRTTPDSSQRYDRLASKNRTAFWMAGNCDTASHRENYIKDLQRAGLDIDAAGVCQETLGLKKSTILSSEQGGSCIRNEVYSTNSKCSQLIGATYKFYLSFENSLCNDYVTEKFFRAASLDLIPVVLNGADMSQIAPPNSYVDAKQFESPKQLVDYLLKVGSDPTLYNSFFEWKVLYQVEETFDGMNYQKNLCRLCSAVHQHIRLPKHSVYDNMFNWWIAKGSCHEGKKFVSHQTKRTG